MRQDAHATTPVHTQGPTNVLRHCPFEGRVTPERYCPQGRCLIDPPARPLATRARACLADSGILYASPTWRWHLESEEWTSWGLLIDRSPGDRIAVRFQVAPPSTDSPSPIHPIDELFRLSALRRLEAACRCRRPHTIKVGGRTEIPAHLDPCFVNLSLPLRFHVRPRSAGSSCSRTDSHSHQIAGGFPQ